MELKYMLFGNIFCDKEEVSGQVNAALQKDFPLCVGAILEPSFEAKVDRTISEDPRVEHVILLIDTKKVTVERHTELNPDGKLGVSCDPDGQLVPVDSINIQFRDYNDSLTDRGLVWVVAGSPTKVILLFREKNDKVQEILTQGEEAIETNLIQLFSLPS